MWPIVDIRKGEIEFLNFKVEQMDREKCQNADTIIEEIVMIYAHYNEVAYPKNHVPLAISYNTDFGVHTILFSTMKNLPYQNYGFPWLAIYTSDPTHDHSSRTGSSDDGCFVEKEKLTLMFQNMLKDLSFYYQFSSF